MMRTYIPRDRLESQPFRMVIDDVFTIKERGVVVTGNVESGALRKGDHVWLIGEGQKRQVVVSGIERPHPALVTPTDNIGLLLRGLTRDDVEIGMVIITEPV